jgi:hypothetical protein
MDKQLNGRRKFLKSLMSAPLAAGVLVTGTGLSVAESSTEPIGLDGAETTGIIVKIRKGYAGRVVIENCSITGVNTGILIKEYPG